MKVCDCCGMENPPVVQKLVNGRPSRATECCVRTLEEGGVYRTNVPVPEGKTSRYDVMFSIGKVIVT